MTAARGIWPERLEWQFLEPDGESEDAGFHDAEFGPFHLKVVVGLDGVFRASVDDDRGKNVEDARPHPTLSAGKMAAIEIMMKLFDAGLVKLVDDVKRIRDAILKSARKA